MDPSGGGWSDHDECSNCDVLRREIRGLTKNIKKTESTKKIVINTCYGGFGLSDLAFREWCRRKNIPTKECTQKFESFSLTTVWGVTGPNDDAETPGKGGDLLSPRNINRDDSVLVQLVEEMGGEVNDRCGKLEIVKIPDDVEWEIEEYDGLEWIAEKHRTWR